MIDTFQLVVLAILQGLTEFLPISSSAHLVIPSLVLGWQDQGLAFDVAVHVGTLAAVVIYYRKDIGQMIVAWLRSVTGGGASDDSRLAWFIVFATIPAGLVGLFGGDFIESNLRTLPVIATTTLVFGLLLGLADRRAVTPGAGRALTLPLAMAIGFAQAFAPVPGVSRSGVTITAGLFLGLDREAAARFSFLLSIPIIASAGALKSWDLVNDPGVISWGQLAAGALISGVAAYLCIAIFLRLLNAVGLMPFVYYRIVLAAVLYGLWLL